MSQLDLNDEQRQIPETAPQFPAGAIAPGAAVAAFAGAGAER